MIAKINLLIIISKSKCKCKYKIQNFQYFCNVVVFIR